MSDYQCPVCDKVNPAFQWTDTHGIAQCYTCGTPTRIYHYEDDNRVEKPPVAVVRDEWIPLLRRYREDTGCIIPGGHSFTDNPQYERARSSDVRAFNQWCKAHKHELPARQEEDS